MIAWRTHYFIAICLTLLTPVLDYFVESVNECQCLKADETLETIFILKTLYVFLLVWTAASVEVRSTDARTSWIREMSKKVPDGTERELACSASP